MEECAGCVFDDKITGCSYKEFIKEKCEYRIPRLTDEEIKDHCDRVEEEL